MSSERAARPLRLPPPDAGRLDIPITRQAPAAWVRVHASQFAPVHFSVNPIHRFSHPGSLYGILYLADGVSTCLFERFGDLAYDGEMAIPKSLWNDHCITTIHIPELQVCDLMDALTLSTLRVDLNGLMTHRLAVPQQWGLALQRHPAGFHGIQFRSRFNANRCLALFKRGEVDRLLRIGETAALPDSEEASEWLDRHRVSLY